MTNCLISATAVCLTVDHNNFSLLYFKAVELYIFTYLSGFTYSSVILLWFANYATKIQHFTVYLTGSSLLCLFSRHRLWVMICLIEEKGESPLNLSRSINKYNCVLDRKDLLEYFTG